MAGRREEYLDTRRHTAEEIDAILLLMEELIDGGSKDHLVQTLLGAASVGLSLWVTGPVGAAVAANVANFFADDSTNQDKTLIAAVKNGHYELQKIYRTIIRRNFDGAKMEVGILKDVDSGVEFYQGVALKAYF